MTAHPANHLFHSLRKIAKAQPPLPAWDEYKAAPGAIQSAIREKWCAIGHGYLGDGTQRAEAFKLYCKATSEMFGSRVRPVTLLDSEEYPGERAGREQDYEPGAMQ